MNKLNFKITDELDGILSKAFEYAAQFKQLNISVESIIYFTIKKYTTTSDGSKLDGDILFKTLDELGVDEKISLERDCYKAMERAKQPIVIAANLYNSDNILLSDVLETAFKRAEGAARLREVVDETDDVVINTEDLFTMLLTEGHIEIIGLMNDRYNVTLDKLVEGRMDNMDKKFLNDNGAIFKEKNLFTEGSRIDPNMSKDDEDERFERAGQRKTISSKKVDPNSKTPSLDQFAVEMTANAKQGIYDPVVGRSKEIDQIVEILCCRKKNNAVLLGDPGCGKTAVIELLSQRIVEGNIPRELKNKRIFSLDLNALVSGTQYRGQYEQRLQDIIKEVTENKDVIIFIDEIHNLIGNGSSSGSGDGANILKPYLARGEFQCIGSTTVDEYRKFIEKDGALKRRFSPVFVTEPTIPETIEILKGLSKTYSKFHHVSYTDEIITKCVEWSGKYINDRYFPDKAISVLDMASSCAKLRKKVDTSNIDLLDDQINNLVQQKIVAINESRFEEAAQLRDTINSLREEKDKQQKELDSMDSKNLVEVTIDDLCSVISKTSNVPIDKIRSSDVAKVKSMKKALEDQIIGQDEAVEQLTLALQRNILGLRNPNKPICSLLLVGPTGVGKSLISKLVAKEFMGSEDSLITIACSEYMQEWAESKLLGSAPGYVGFSDSEPRLYVLKRKPYSVLLIDEVEKSNSNLYNIWLNMLEEGEITLSTGEKVSCRNSIIIFTGNVGTKALALKGNGIGFQQLNKDDKRKADVETVMKEVKKEFRPEFLNRLSKVVVFNSLGTEELGKIFYLELKKLQDRLLENNGYTLTVTDALKDFIVSKCEPEYGARSLQRLLVEHIEQEICKVMLDQDIEGKKNIQVDYIDEKVNIIFS